MEEILDFEKPIEKLQNKLEGLKLASNDVIDLSKQIKDVENNLNRLRNKIYSNLTPWQCTMVARHPLRPHSSNYIKALFNDFIELHGDRSFRDDPSIICGIGSIDNISAVIIGHEKGRGTDDSIYRNFGMPHPEGYRKALRMFKLAEKFNLPIITLIDTPGAYPGIDAENRGQSMAIAENLIEMANLKVPIITIIIGEGGSGGALAIGVADKVFMLENSVFSVITPEGCAAILYRSAEYKEIAALNLKLNAHSHFEMGLIDGIIPEPLGGAHKNPKTVINSVGNIIKENLIELSKIDKKTLCENRYNKYRTIGKYNE